MKGMLFAAICFHATLHPTAKHSLECGSKESSSTYQLFHRKNCHPKQ